MTDEEYRQALSHFQGECTDISDEIVEYLWRLIYHIKTEESKETIEVASLFQNIMNDLDTLNKLISQMRCVASAH